MNKQLLKFFDEVFECNYKVYLGFTEQEFIDDVERYGISKELTAEYLSGTDGVCVGTDSGGYAIWLRDSDLEKPSTIGVLVHECMHVVLSRVVKSCGVDASEQETLAFYIGFLVRTILTKAKAKGKGKKHA